jgi:hypothetical protein
VQGVSHWAPAYIGPYSQTVGVSNTYIMHVQGVSHWAPAYIGPYSQTVGVSNTHIMHVQGCHTGPLHT